MIEQNEYRKRIADILLERELQVAGAVLIQGPKWCGKTTTAEQHAKSLLYMNDPDNLAHNLSLADMQPTALLEGETPRLIDEWQLAPTLWDTVRFTVDHRRGKGQFILTGSAVPADLSQVHHSGTGRFSRITMRPMSLFESGDSNGSVSLQTLFEGGKEISGATGYKLEDIAYLICRGGWPDSLYMDKDLALREAFNYYNDIVSEDINRVDGKERDTEKVKKFMRSYARHQGSMASYKTISNDINEGVDAETISTYTSLMRKIFVIEDATAWNPNIRSRTAIRTSNTRYFTDPSIATAALGLGPSDLMNDLNTMGLFFETLCMRDLRVYAEVIDGQVFHYRDADELECDAVIHLRNGSYGLVEIKLGGQQHINKGIETLQALKAKINTDKMKEPAFMMVLTAVTPHAYYDANNDVCVVPIGCLKN